MLFDCKTYNKNIKTDYFLQKYELMIEIPFVRNEDMLIDTEIICYFYEYLCCF